MEKVTLTVIFKGTEGYAGMRRIASEIANEVGGNVITVIQVSSVKAGDTEIHAKGKGFQAVISVPAMTKHEARTSIKRAGVASIPVSFLSIQ